MRTFLLALMLAQIGVPAAAADRPSSHDRTLQEARRSYDRTIRHATRNRFEATREWRRKYRGDWREFHRFDWDRPDPYYRGYFADYYYRDARYYRTFPLAAGDRIYRGSDGQAYCRRADGTTGLVIASQLGTGFANDLAPGQSRLLAASADPRIAHEIRRKHLLCR